MKIDEIQDMIKDDSVIDNLDLDGESLKIPQLHARYYRILMDEMRAYKLTEFDYKTTKKSRRLYYTGKASDEEYRDEPMNIKAILKDDVEMFLDADEKLSKIKLKLELQKMKIEMLEAFIKTLTNRNFLIKNAIDWRRFQQGA